MPGPGLYLVDIEFCHHMRGKIFQLNGWVAALVILAGNEFAKGIRRNRNSLARLRRKMQTGFGF